MSTTVIPTEYQNANPLLYTFRDYHTTIQPYFIIVGQFLFFECSLRLWDKAVYGTWQLPGEMIELVKDEEPGPTTTDHPETKYSFTVSTVYILQSCKKLSFTTKKAKKLPTFDLSDAFLSLPLLAHAIWYCIVQSNCSSSANATTWNCYNLFGYRIYNYLFDNFTDLTYSFISKLIIIHNCRKLKLPLPHTQHKKGWRRGLATVSFYIGLVFSLVAFCFLAALVLPYLFTNAFPMAIIYSFMVAIYAYIVSIITLLLKFFTKLTGGGTPPTGKEGFFKSKLRKVHYKPQMVVQAGLRLFPRLMSILFNLSQYFYYGEDFWTALGREADTRDPSLFFSKFVTAAQIGHTILSTL